MRGYSYFFLLVTGLPLAADGTGAVIHLVDGKTLSLADVSLHDAGRISGTGDSGPIEVAPSDILAIDFPGAERRAPHVPAFLLPGREMIHGEITASSEEAVDIESELFGQISIPLGAIEAVIVTQKRMQGDGKEELASRLRSLPRDADALLLANGDVISCAVTSFGPGPWKIERDGKPQEVEPELLDGAALDKNLLEYQPPKGEYLLLTLTDGTLMAAKSIVTHDDRAEIVTVLGPTISVPWAGGQGAGLARIDFRGSRVVYLSDLAPRSIEHLPFLDDQAPPRMDRNVGGGPLRLAGQRYFKGIGARSYTRIDFDVAGFERFLCQVGIDEAASESASLEFKVLADGKEVFKSGEMTVGIKPQNVDIPMAGVRVLSLVVDYARRGDIGDWADWIDARLVRPKPTS